MLYPKKSKEFIKPTAKQLDVEESLVQNLVDFYWKDVRKNLSDLKGPRIAIANFGSFNIKHWLLKELRDNYQKHLDTTESVELTFHKHRIRLDVEERIKAVDSIMKMVDIDLERKKQVKIKRHGTIVKTDLESPDADS